MAIPRTAGFASVTTVGEDIANSVLAAVASNVTMPKFSLPSVIVVGTDQVGASGILELIAPQVSFTQNPSNLIAVTFACAGALRITSTTSSGTVSLAEFDVKLTATINLAFSVNTNSSSIAVVLDTSSANVSSVSIDVDYGPPLVTLYQNALTSDPVLSALTKAIRAIPDSALTLTIPGARGSFKLNVGDFSVALAISRVVVVPLDGVLDVACDVFPYTRGDASSLVNLIAVPAPTPLYFALNQYGEEDLEGGTFGAHVGVGPEDGYAPSFGVNLATAINPDFLTAIFDGPLSQQLSGTYLNIEMQDFFVSHTVADGDTMEQVAASLLSQLMYYEAGPYQYLANVGIGVSLTGLTFTISCPPSLTPPNITASAVTNQAPTESVSVSGSNPNISATISGPATRGDTVVVAITFPSKLSMQYTLAAGDGLSTAAANLAQQFNSGSAAQQLQSAGIMVANVGASINFSGSSSAPFFTVSGSAFRNPTETVVVNSGSLKTSIALGGYTWPGDVVSIVIPAGGVQIASVSLAVQGINNSNIANSSPELPTTWYPCLTLTLNGAIIQPTGPTEGDSSQKPGPQGWGWTTLATFTFSASLCPILKQTLNFDYLWTYPLVEWNISSSLLSAIEDIGDVLFPFGPLFFGAAVGAALNSIVANGLAGSVAEGISTGSYRGSAPFPGVPNWNLNYTLAGIVIAPTQADQLYAGDEIDAYAAVTITGPTASPFPPFPSFSMSANDSESLTSLAPIPVTLNIVNSAPLLDPALGILISWTASRNDTGATVSTPPVQALSAPGATSLLLQRANGPTGDLIYNDTWTVTCEVYRPGDSTVPRFSYYKNSIQIGQQDVVNRHHPYVIWRHKVFIHDPHGPPPLKSHHFWTRNRKSRVHRTDLLTRCSMLDRARESALAQTYSNIPLQYLDSLAEFGTLAELTNPHVVSRKASDKVLCDYCFFGGPTKTKWRTPTAPTPEWT